MGRMTLREVCGTCGVSRRAVQGYEKVGLVSPSGKNARGYLLYDEGAQERIRQIRLLQQIGFQVKEIKEMLDAPCEVRTDALKRQLGKLREEETNIGILISRVSQMIEDNN